MTRVFVHSTLLFVLTLQASFLLGQGLDTLRIDFQSSAGSLLDNLSRLQQSIEVKIALSDSTISVTEGHNYQGAFLENVLSDLLKNTGLDYLLYRDYLIVIADRETLSINRPTTYYHALQESIDAERHADARELVIGSVSMIEQTGAIAITGTVTDGETGDPVIGATLITKETGKGSGTDDQGIFNLQLPPGAYTLTVQYIGYQERQIPIRVISSGTLDLQLNKSSILLDEIVVEAKKRDENIQSTQVGVSRLSIREIEKLPSFLGEVDVIKGLLQQPGVSTIGEGSSGFNVRGGTVDQNLILMDEGMIFNASHALGFFSSFNTDIVSDALLHKGNMPSKFGGRLSSVLDVNVKDGNFEKIKFRGGLGIVSSRLTLEGPLVQNKTSFLLSGRSSYSDWLLQNINLPEVKNSSAFFYDVNVKLTHRFNEKNFISLAGYSTSDQFTYNNEFGFDYATQLGLLNYRSVFGKNILSTLSIAVSDYSSNQFDLEGTNASDLSVANQYLKVKENINYSVDNLEINAGLSWIDYRVDPGELNPTGTNSVVIPRKVDRERGREIAFYSDASLQISPRFSWIAGLRLTNYQFLGPHSLFDYENPSQPIIEEILQRKSRDQQIIHAEWLLQPRFSARYLLDAATSLKLGYARASQYINQISNTDTPTPTNVWKLTNPYIPSQLSHNFSLGVFKNYLENIWITGFEVYYRSIDRLIDYRDFADLIANNHLETELLTGTGKTYGAELSIKKQVGMVHGWFNYTFSRSLRKIEGINKNDWYPSNFDKPHDLSLVANYQLNKRNTLSLNFTLSSGRALTIPVDRHRIEGKFIALNFSERNAFRAPTYHRLDIAYTLGQGYRKSRKFKTSWTFSVYNVYARRNAFSIYLVQEALTNPRIRQLSVLGNAFPSLTFNFELL